MRLLILIAFISSQINARDLGSFGATFAIVEENPIEMILRKLNGLSETGELDSHQKIVQERIRQRAMNPNPVTGITKATTNKTRFYDPSIRVPYDLKDHQGTIFHRAGTIVNPLTRQQFMKPFVFINGEDKEQVDWALKQLKEDSTTKIILVQGSPFTLSELYGIRFYFDQQGKLVEKLGIKEVPARVSRNQDKLQIDNIALGGDQTP